MSDGIYKMFLSTSPHFFKVVVTDTLRDRNILIPEKFVRKYEKGLQSPVILKLPSGLEWKVELTSCNGKVWLQKGWPEFADHLSIRRGHLLLFRYEGNSLFHVIIFDISATEIDYPTNNSTHLLNSNYIEIDDDDQLQEPKMDEVEDDIDSVNILDDNLAPLFPKTENKSSLHCPRPQKRMRTTSYSGLKHLSASERARAVERARSFKSENPFFWVVMEPSYVSLANLHVPKKFAERYINKKEVDFTLRDLDGRSWFVRYRNRRRSGTSDSPEMLNPGWKAFAKDNNLKVGDVCIFELISNIGNDICDISVFQVSIDRHANHLSLDGGSANNLASYGSGNEETLKTKNFRMIKQNAVEPTGNYVCDNEDQDPQKSSTGASGKVTGRPPSPKEAFDSFQAKGNKSPSFIMLVKEYNLKHSILAVPTSFASGNFEKRGQNVKLKVENRWWDVKVIRCPYTNRCALSKGWRAFARDNCLRPGDVCRFQMIQRSPLQLQVFIERVST